MKKAASYSSKVQQQLWKDNVEKCMTTLAEAKVEVYRPDKSLFADKSKAVLEQFVKDPKMKSIIDEISAQ